MGQLYQDAMARVRKFGKPDLFVTFTCNPKWKQITDALLPGQTAKDRPDLVTCVFNLKLDALLKDIKDSVLGSVIIKIWVIEFQKRGLPHAHILLILDEMSKLRTVEDYDSMVSAEIPDPICHPKTYETITLCMVHGPCGPNSTCNAWSKESGRKGDPNSTRNAWSKESGRKGGPNSTRNAWSKESAKKGGPNSTRNAWSKESARKGTRMHGARKVQDKVPAFL
jgi:hypothetical protein